MSPPGTTPQRDARNSLHHAAKCETPHLKRHWKTYLEVGLTVASVAVPIVGAAVWGLRAYRVVKAARAFHAGAPRASGSIRARRPTVALAGRIFVGRGATRDKAKNGALWLQKGRYGYRSATKKHGYGWSSDLTTFRKGDHNYKVFHVNHRSRFR